MHHVRELDVVADEEHGQVVAHQVEVPVDGLEFDCKPSRVAQCLRGIPAVDDGGEPNKDLGFPISTMEHPRLGVLAEVYGRCEHAMGPSTSSMYHPLGSALKVEPTHFLQ